jgi:hypothetical protein
MCRSCGSSNQTEFGSEIMIHRSGLSNLDKPSVLAFPKITACLDCGFSGFSISRAELTLLGHNCGASVA